LLESLRVGWSHNLLDRRSSPSKAFQSGQLLFFRHGIVHSHLSISQGTVIALSVDAPSWEPKDIAFMTQPVVLWRALTADSHIEATDGIHAKA
jgi:hypothetical protein